MARGAKKAIELAEQRAYSRASRGSVASWYRLTMRINNRVV